MRVTIVTRFARAASSQSAWTTLDIASQLPSLGQQRHLVAPYGRRPQYLRGLVVFELGKLVPNLGHELIEIDRPFDRVLAPQDAGQRKGEGAVAGGAVAVLVGELLFGTSLD